VNLKSLCFLLTAALSMSFSAASPPRSLDATLARLARVAELYRDSALGFACGEAIAYSGIVTGHIQFAYIFIRDDHGRLRDYRTWKTKTGGPEVNPSDYGVPRFLESAYLWAFVFRSDRQPLYRFELLGDDTVGGRPAVVIKFVPRAPIRNGLNDWAGYARIDAESSQILEVEAYTPADWNRKLRRDAEAAAAPAKHKHGDTERFDVERIVTSFGFEKNGMRFPSRVAITKTRTTIVPGKAQQDLVGDVLRAVTQDYTKFEFFSVRSSDEITRFVEGHDELPAVATGK